MNSKLKYLFEALEKDKRDLLQEVSGLSHDELNYSATSGSWSVSQIIAHLMTAESGSLQYMKKKYLGVDRIGNSGFREGIKLWILKISQRLPIKYKAPKVIIENTPQLFSFEELSRQWENSRYRVGKISGWN